MHLDARRFLLFWGAVLAAGCTGSSAKSGPEPDAAVIVPVYYPDAARDRDLPRGVVGPPDADGPRAELDAAAHDARHDGGRDAGRDPSDAGESDAPVIPIHDCSAGHTCSANARCQRACIGQLIYRCSCADGRFVCTGCISVDGGAPDLRGGPGVCAGDVGEGRRCDTAGAVCQQRGDGPQRLCACGELGANRIWICQ
jgi:hypothetical protein